MTPLNMLSLHVVCVLLSGDSAKGTLKVDIKCGVPFEPVNVYKMLQAIDFEAFKVKRLMSCFYGCKLSRDSI